MKLGQSNDTLLIIDGSHLGFRCFSTTELTTSSGLGVGAVFGSVKSIANMVSKFKAKYCAVLYDRGRNKKRMSLMSSYKEKKETDPVKLEQKRKDKERFHDQVAILLDLLPSLGIYAVGTPDMEADDAAAILADLYSGNSVLSSGDKDWLQLVNERVRLYNPSRDYTVTHENRPEYVKLVEKKDSIVVADESWSLYRALVGDSSDGIKGLPGAGPVAACKYVQGCVTLEDLLEKYKDDKKIMDKLNPHIEDIKIYLKVMDLANSANDVDFVQSFNQQLTNATPKKDLELFIDKCKEYEFKSIYSSSYVFLNKFRSLTV